MKMTLVQLIKNIENKFENIKNKVFTTDRYNTINKTSQYTYLIVKPISFRDFEQDILSHSIKKTFEEKNIKNDDIKKYTQDINYAIRLYNQELRKKISIESLEEKEEFLKQIYEKFQETIVNKEYLEFKKTLGDILLAHDSNFHSELFFYDELSLEKKVEAIANYSSNILKTKNDLNDKYLLSASEKLTMQVGSIQQKEKIKSNLKKRKVLLSDIRREKDIRNIKKRILEKNSRLAWIKNYESFKQIFQDYNTITKKDTFIEFQQYIYTKQKIALSYNKVNKYLESYFDSSKTLEQSVKNLNVSSSYISKLARKYIEFKKTTNDEIKNINGRIKANNSNYFKDLKKINPIEYQNFIEYLKNNKNQKQQKFLKIA